MPTALVGAFASLIVIVCIGVYLAFSTGLKDRNTTQGSTEPGHEVEGVNISTPSGDANWTISKATITAATYRKGLMFCVLGQSFVAVAPITAGWCDYTIYPDLTIVNDRFQPRYRRSTWEAFQKGFAAQMNVAPGVSFSLSHSDATTRIPAMGTQLSDLAQTARVRAMGVLNFARHSSPNTNTLTPMFKAFTKALSWQSDLVHTTFLGVWLYTQNAAMEFASEVVSMHDNLNTIILQTHMSELHASPATCISRPICVMASVDTLPSFRIAEATVSLLREADHKFRIVFSSTLGVMIYAGAAGGEQPSGANKPCDWSYMEDYDFTCNDSVLSGKRRYDSDGKYEYVSYNDDDRQYYVTYESSRSIAEKCDMYIPNISEGWALFEIQRDVGAKCSPFGLNYERLETTQSIARNRTHVG
ncbi:uncharacterized protein LOC142583525 [Dermacentor variabilis]|uniref:uncharacterized protein LOC142583525 n=1 Tax=Dermacentor variabilis TaxID=34621 RepID=UPI003F5C4EAB